MLTHFGLNNFGVHLAKIPLRPLAICGIALASLLSFNGCDDPAPINAYNLSDPDDDRPAPSGLLKPHYVATGQQSSESGQAAQAHSATETPDLAVAQLFPVGGSGVTGVAYFEKVDEGLRVYGQVTGLTPGKHGFHVHQYGDLTDLQEGKSLGGHFDPMGHEHGERTAEIRHAGDFGNIEAGADGVAKFEFTDQMASFSGQTSVIGRGLVVHAGEDKFTQPTGDAGGRVAVGTIGIAEAK